MSRIPLKMVILLTALLAVVVFLLDNFLYLVKFDLSIIAISLRSIRNFLIMLIGLGWYLIIRKRFVITNKPLSIKLLYLLQILTANLIIGGLLYYTLEPVYEGEVNLTYANYSALLYANICGLLAIASIIPLLFLMREFIFYKQKRTTQLYFNLFIGVILLSSVIFFFEKEPTHLFDFENSNFIHSLLSIVLILLIILLAFRNDWLTYLPRRDKFLYFFLGGIVLIELSLLWKLVYSPHLVAYSKVIGNVGNIVWHFLIIYCSFALLTLLVHLPTARAVDRKLKEVSSLYEFARELNSELNYSRLTQLITQLTARVLESSTTWLELREGQETELKVMSHINLSREQIEQNPFDKLSGFNESLLREKRPVLINDVSAHRELQQVTKWMPELRSLIATPLFSNREQLMGIIYAGKNQPYGFDVDDVSLMEAFANQFAIALENAHLWASSIERERLEQELKIAREVQLKLLPQQMPNIPNFELDSYFLTAYEVGGDYYDTFQFSDGKPGFVIGDVSGKGTSAAFYMAEFKGVIQTLAQHTSSPLKLISQANRIFYNSIEKQMFVTAIVGKLFPEKRKFQFVRAGHPPVVHCSSSSKTATFIQPPGLGIGLDRGTLFDKIIRLETIQLKRGDFLLVFTDGLLEIRNPDNEEFGEERLMELLKNCSGGTATEIKERILNALLDFTSNAQLHDDLTLIVIKCQE
ncbi:MAG: GAF domain-containing protein [Calditrichaeota bacterium]|nr:MAG: GAF domain-containing protein [Calditrichota bacterium]